MSFTLDTGLVYGIASPVAAYATSGLWTFSRPGCNVFDQVLKDIDSYRIPENFCVGYGE
jgi:hypothetical protein